MNLRTARSLGQSGLKLLLQMLVRYFYTILVLSLLQLSIIPVPGITQNKTEVSQSYEHVVFVSCKIRKEDYHIVSVHGNQLFEDYMSFYL